MMNTRPETIPWVCSFPELNREHLSWVGGKGANLGEMVQQKLPVPPGFCITTRAYRAFLEAAGTQAETLFQELDALTAEETQKARDIGLSMRTLLRETPIPPDVCNAIIQAWNEFGAEHAYAIRSSATAEDLPDASFAGQQDTYLNIQGDKSILEHVRRCWASLFTDRAIVYRTQQGFGHREVALSVVVQQMVLPELSGILFTVDPLLQNRNILSIDAGFGLGEALVSGKVSADLYKIDKRTRNVVASKIADKQQAIWPLPGGGTEERPLPEEQRKAQVLSNTQLQELTDLALQVEEHYGSPQDIEWCIAQGQLYLVQSRPITSLYPLLATPPKDGTLHAYISFNHVQVMLDPIRPLGESVLRLIIPFGKEAPLSANNPYLQTIGGRLYLDMTPALRHPIPFRIVPKILTVVSSRIAASIRDFVQRPRFLAERKQGKRIQFFASFRKLIFPRIQSAIKKMWFHKPEGTIERLEEYIETEMKKVEERLHNVEGSEVIPAIKETLGPMFQVKLLPHFFPHILAGMLSAKFLGIMTGRTLNDPQISKLMRGLKGNITTEMDLQVADLAAVARRFPQVHKALQANPTTSVLEELQLLEGGSHFLRELQEFQERFGMRGPSEIDLTRERWNENPTPLLQTIAGNLTRDEEHDHRAHHKKLTQIGDEAGEAFVHKINRGLFGWLKAPIARRLVRVHRNLMGLREHPKYMLIRHFGIVKKVLLREAQNHVKRDAINEVDDIYFLFLDELDSLFAGAEHWKGTSWKDLVSKRKQQHIAFEKLTPPGVVSSEGEILIGKIERKDLPEGAWPGSPASAGVTEGIARVILDPQDAVLHDGEILVAPFTDPGWTPLFVHASALVMEVGGLMTHGSVVAREYGIPAVVDLPNATKLIQTGQRIRVHGDAGYVELLHENDESTSHDASFQLKRGEKPKTLEASLSLHSEEK